MHCALDCCQKNSSLAPGHLSFSSLTRHWNITSAKCSTFAGGLLLSRRWQMSNEEFPKEQIEKLWAPWRVEYFEKQPRDLEFLTAAARASDDAAHLVLTRRKTAFLMMNRYPYSVGHLMAVPYKKTAELSSLGENEIVDLWNLVIHAQALLRAAARAQGFNIGLNLGECAGAGVADHLHIHIVPRWSGDTNFMPVIAGTKTISEGLRALYDKLIDAQNRLEREGAR
jgi:ATP adenylyltransferase